MKSSSSIVCISEMCWRWRQRVLWKLLCAICVSNTHCTFRNSLPTSSSKLRAGACSSLDRMFSSHNLKSPFSEIFLVIKFLILIVQYIRSCFENYRIPRLILRLRKRIFRDYPPPPKIFEVLLFFSVRCDFFFYSSPPMFVGNGTICTWKMKGTWSLPMNCTLPHQSHCKLDFSGIWMTIWSNFSIFISRKK